MEREWGENPLRLNCRCVHRMFLYPLSKDSHWETEKAGYKNADYCLYGASHKTCFGIILYVFICIEIIFSVAIQLNCDSSQKNSAVVIFQKITAAYCFMR